MLSTGLALRDVYVTLVEAIVQELRSAIKFGLPTDMLVTMGDIAEDLENAIAGRPWGQATKNRIRRDLAAHGVPPTAEATSLVELIDDPTAPPERLLFRLLRVVARRPREPRYQAGHAIVAALLVYGRRWGLTTLKEHLHALDVAIALWIEGVQKQRWQQMPPPPFPFLAAWWERVEADDELEDLVNSVGREWAGQLLESFDRLNGTNASNPYPPRAMDDVLDRLHKRPNDHTSEAAVESPAEEPAPQPVPEEPAQQLVDEEPAPQLAAEAPADDGDRVSSATATNNEQPAAGPDVKLQRAYSALRTEGWLPPRTKKRGRHMTRHTLAKRAGVHHDTAGSWLTRSVAWRKQIEEQATAVGWDRVDIARPWNAVVKGRMD